jgi:hypothetical protein
MAKPTQPPILAKPNPVMVKAVLKLLLAQLKARKQN